MTMKYNYKIAYITRVIYPDTVAHALQMIQMAAAFADQTGDTGLFVRDLTKPASEIRRHYAINDSSLHIWSLHTGRAPSPIRGYYGHPAICNSIIAMILGSHPAWRLPRDKRKVLFNRGVREFPYWGLVKPYLCWLKDWLSVYEAHDIAGIDLQAVEGKRDTRDYQRCMHALRNYDLITCVTQALADDLKSWSDGALQPYVVRHASSLPRLPHPPQLGPFTDRVVLGYIGSIDRERGVNSLIDMLHWLPERYVLRLVGRIPEQSKGSERPEWLKKLVNEPGLSGRIELIPPVPITQVTQEIDQCDILLQPASKDVISLRYRAPLKLFDYMVRGKPIVAADVPCHHELLQDEATASLYPYDDLQQLAARVKALVEYPQQAQAIAQRAWEQSVDYSYPARARRTLELIDQTWEQRSAKKSA